VESFAESTSGTTLGAPVTEALTEQLRRKIISGEIAPGEKIRIKDIENAYGVSHIPIREALRRLEAEHLVTSIPRRGSIAAAVSVQQLIDLYDIRKMLEPELAARAASIIDSDELEQITQRLLELDTIIQEEPANTRFIEADQEFHWSILRHGATAISERLIRQLWQLSERYVRLGMTRRDAPKQTMEQHHEIVDAIARRDCSSVSEAVRRHLSLTEDAVRELDADKATLIEAG
jgi:DNA-binding GntR family transcriptional regulator